MSIKRNSSMVAIVYAHLLFAGPVQTAGSASQNWEESNNRIVLDSVCAEHKYGSINSRECRAAASKLFKQKCKELTTRYNSASSKYRAKDKQRRDKFCTAARHFRVVE